MGSLVASSAEPLPGTEPCPRSGHVCVHDDEFMYIHGGYSVNAAVPHSPTAHTDLHRYHFATRRWEHCETIGNGPATPISHSGIIDGQYILIFGGTAAEFGVNVSNDLHVLDLSTGEWRLLDGQGDRPAPRYGQSFTRRPGTDELYLFGGTSGHKYFNDLHVFDLSTLTWRLVPPYDPEEDMLSSGSGLSTPMSGLLVGSPTRTYLEGLRSPTGGASFPSVLPSQQPEQRPCVRYRHAAAADESHLFILGGGFPFPPLDSVPFLDVYTHEFATRRWTCLSSGHASAEAAADPAGSTDATVPSNRLAHTVVPFQGALYVYGGCQRATMSNAALWRFDLTSRTWTSFDLSPVGWAPLFFHTAAVTSTGRLSVFGGCLERASDNNGQNIAIASRNNKVFERWLTVPPLVDLCIQTILDNRELSREFSESGSVPAELMERVFPLPPAHPIPPQLPASDDNSG